MQHKYELDNGYGNGVRLGLIVLSTDETLENETREILAGRPVSMLHTRIPAQSDVTPELLQTMAEEMTSSAARLPKGLDVIGYACTSGATVIGPERVEELIKVAHPDALVTNPITAVSEALRAFDVHRIAFGSPYVESVTQPMCDYLARQGIEIGAQSSFAVADDYTVARITEAAARTMLLDLAKDETVEALFTSCTNLRTFGIIDAVEEETGRPVISSNLALIWHMLRLAGIDMRGWGPGRLFNL